MPSISKYRRPFNAMDLTISAAFFGMFGKELSRTMRERYSVGKFTFHINQDYRERGYMKIAIKHTDRILVCELEDECCRWSITGLIKNTLIPEDCEDDFLADFETNMLVPQEYENEDEVKEYKELCKTTIPTRWDTSNLPIHYTYPFY